MKNLLTLAFAALLLNFISSCKKVSGEGPVISQTRSLSDFTQIKSEIAGDVIITPGDKYEVIIEAQENILDVIETVLTGNKLTIRVKNNTIIREKNVTVKITTPAINGLELHGSGNIDVKHTVDINKINLELSGSGNLFMNKLLAEDLVASIGGSGSMYIGGGSVNSEQVTISGSGSMDFLELKSKYGNVEINGSGDVKIQVTERLKVRINGSGNVYYRGNPELDVEIKGSGKCRNI